MTYKQLLEHGNLNEDKKLLLPLNGKADQLKGNILLFDLINKKSQKLFNANNTYTIYSGSGGFGPSSSIIGIKDGSKTVMELAVDQSYGELILLKYEVFADGKKVRIPTAKVDKAQKDLIQKNNK